MAARRRRRWEDLDHSREPLIQEIVGRNHTRIEGPIPQFLNKKQAERAPKTYAWYKEALTQLTAFFESRGLGLVEDLNEDNVNAFRVHLQQRGASENTISNRLRAVRSLANWMKAKGWVEVYPLGTLKVPQSVRPEFDLIPDEGRRSLFALYNPNTFLGSRNLAMLGVLSDTGLRREELVNVEFRNLDLDSHVLKVYSDKTEEWRYLPLTDEVSRLLKNYLRSRDRYFGQTARYRTTPGCEERRRVPRAIQCDKLFVSWRGTRLRPESLGFLIYRASRRAGVAVKPHDFRRDFLTRKALDGENPSIVKRWAGHKNYVMTDYYFQVAEQMLGAIKPKRSVLSSIGLPGVQAKGRRFKRLNETPDVPPSPGKRRG